MATLLDLVAILVSKPGLGVTGMCTATYQEGGKSVYARRPYMRPVRVESLQDKP